MIWFGDKYQYGYFIKLNVHRQRLSLVTGASSVIFTIYLKKLHHLWQIYFFLRRMVSILGISFLLLSSKDSAISSIARPYFLAGIKKSDI